MTETERFLPYIDNWMTCDQFSPKVFAKHKQGLVPHVLKWLESHLCMIPMFPRRPGCSVVEGKDITKPKVQALAAAADACWNAILARDLDGFAAAYKASFEAQIAMFPAMIQPGVQEYIDKYSAMPGVLAWKMPGAGGGGYLALVCSGPDAFPEGAIPLTIRRPGM